MRPITSPSTSRRTSAWMLESANRSGATPAPPISRERAALKASLRTSLAASFSARERSSIAAGSPLPSFFKWRTRSVSARPRTSSAGARRPASAARSGVFSSSLPSAVNAASRTSPAASRSICRSRWRRARVAELGERLARLDPRGGGFSLVSWSSVPKARASWSDASARAPYRHVSSWRLAIASNSGRRSLRRRARPCPSSAWAGSGLGGAPFRALVAESPGPRAAGADPCRGRGAPRPARGRAITDTRNAARRTSRVGFALVPAQRRLHLGPSESCLRWKKRTSATRRSPPAASAAR